LLFQDTRLNSNQCLGIIEIGQTSNITVHNNSNNLSNFDLTSEIQFAKSLAPDIQLVSYTGISILSALKTAIIDQINRPNLLLLNYTCSVFDLSKTELQELNYWVDIAKNQDILIVSPRTESNKNVIEKESLINKLKGSLKTHVNMANNSSAESIPVDYQGDKYLIPLPQMNAVLWALRLLSISSDFNQSIKKTSKLSIKFLKQILKPNQLHDLFLPFIMPGTKKETEYFYWISTQIKSKGGCCE
jgi:hypothetical protein